MVVTWALPTADRGVMQARTGSPFRCTVQAPHSAMPQPNLVPFICSSPRSTHSRGVSGSALTAMGWPLRFRVVVMGAPVRRVS